MGLWFLDVSGFTVYHALSLYGLIRPVALFRFTVYRFTLLCGLSLCGLSIYISLTVEVEEVWDDVGWC